MQKGDEESIRRRAYELWEQEGRPEGRHEHHWQRAREQLTGRGEGRDLDPEMSSMPSDPTAHAAPDQPEDMSEQEKAMIPQNGAEILSQTAEPEPGSAPTPPAKRPRTQRRKVPLAPAS